MHHRPGGEQHPPTGTGFRLGSLTQCLGDDPPVLIEQGTVQAFTPYPCVDASGDCHHCISLRRKR